MNTFRVFLLVGYIASAAEPLVPPAKEGVRSPRIEALKRIGPTGAAQFWKEMKAKGTPLVEPVAGDPTQVLVTFVFQGQPQTNRVVLAAQLAKQRGEVIQLARVAGTDVWYRTYQFRNDMRFGYSFAPEPVPSGASENGRVPDPLNPKSLRQGVVFGNSIAELPEAPPQPWNDPKLGVAHGGLVQEVVESKILTSQRRAWLYTPTGYDVRRPTAYPVLVCFDGSSYRSGDEIPVPTILDNLIAARRIPPMIAVLVEQSPQPVRNVELGNNEPFAAFVAEELLPQVRRKWNATADPAQTIVTGSSAGGLGSAYAAFLRPQVFGNVLSQSGAFWPGKTREDAHHEWLIDQYQSSRKLPVRFVLQAGILEIVPTPLNGPPILASNRRMRDVLLTKGYEVHYHEIAGGHEPLSWRGGLAEGLIELMPLGPPR